VELRQLEYFAAVARHRHFGRAAEAIYVTQPALSQQVRRLEAELGVDLLRRSSRSVTVTDAGEVVLDYARRVLTEVDGLQAELEELSGVLRGRVAIGAIWPTGTYDLPGVLGTFHHRHPGVEIHLREHTADHLLDLLRRDELDCAFASVDPDTLGDEFAATLLWEDELVVAMAPGHDLCAKGEITFEELAAEDLIAYRDNSAMRRRLERTMAERGLEPHNAFVCTEMAAVRGLASKGLGVAMIPRSAAEAPGAPIELRPIGPKPLTWPIALVWRVARRQAPAGKAFIALALKHAKGTDGAELRAA
jgi:DNA-binding transcriptional LysR family regulator